MVQRSDVSDAQLRGLEAALGDRLPSILTELGDVLEVDYPDYADILRTSEPEEHEAAGLFVRRLVEMIEHGLDECGPSRYGVDGHRVPGRGPTATRPTDLQPDPSLQTVFEQIGRVHYMNGRELTDLQAAYQVGARATWRHISRAALELNLDKLTLTELAEAVFVLVNQLSAATVSGYLLEQSLASTARDRWRDELARLLLSDRSQPAEVRLAARRAGWLLPERAMIVLVDPDDEAAKAKIDSLGGQMLPVRLSQLYGAIVPVGDQARIRRRISRAMRGARAVVGAVAALQQLPATVPPARTALVLRRRGLFNDDPLFVTDHVDALLIHRDERLYQSLRSQVLAALDSVPARTRARLLETLTAWLRHMGNRAAVAEELHVHPQTVRYRLAQLREAFGDALDAPETRARLFLALMWDDRPESERTWNDDRGPDDDRPDDFPPDGDDLGASSTELFSQDPSDLDSTGGLGPGADPAGGTMVDRP